MDSDDDMYECYSDNDVESGSYDDGGGDYDADAVDYAENDDSDDLPSHREQNYTVLTEADIRQLQGEDITKLSNVLSISKVHSCIHLCTIIACEAEVCNRSLGTVKCRRVLRWTYGCGYYIPEQENAKRQLFEYLQGEAESGLERLHACAEKELQDYFDAESPSGDSEEFIAFRCKLAGLTSVTRNYFENLVHAFEAGLKEMRSSQERVMLGCCLWYLVVNIKCNLATYQMDETGALCFPWKCF